MRTKHLALLVLLVLLVVTVSTLAVPEMVYVKYKIKDADHPDGEGTGYLYGAPNMTLYSTTWAHPSLAGSPYIDVFLWGYPYGQPSSEPSRFLIFVDLKDYSVVSFFTYTGQVESEWHDELEIQDVPDEWVSIDTTFSGPRATYQVYVKIGDAEYGPVNVSDGLLYVHFDTRTEDIGVVRIVYPETITEGGAKYTLKEIVVNGERKTGNEVTVIPTGNDKVNVTVVYVTSGLTEDATVIIAVVILVTISIVVIFYMYNKKKALRRSISIVDNNWVEEIE